MEISKEQMDEFFQVEANKAKESIKGYEWSFSYRTDYQWSSDIFDNVILYLKSDSDFKETITYDTLIVTPMDGGPQLYIQEVPNISKYCFSDTPSTIPHKWYKRNLISSEALPEEFPLNIVSHIIEKVEITDDNSYPEWDSVTKHYRLVKEFIYEGKNVIYKISMVRESSDPYTTMNESGVSFANIAYEFETIIKNDYDNIIEIVQNCVRMIQLLTGQMHPLSKTQRSQIIQEYHTLLKTVVEIPKWRRDENQPFFFAPKPITLEIQNLVEPSPESYGVQSIYVGYCVTDKADGERMLLYIAKNRKAYIINNILDVYDTGLYVTSDAITETLLDGEFVNMRIRKDDSSYHLFAVFDIYFMKGKSVMNLPLIGKGDKACRNTVMKQMCEKGLYNSKFSNIEIRAKEHVFAEGSIMKDTCAAFLQNAKNLPYDIDGLVFTPAYLSVFGYYPGKEAKITDNVRWDKVLKWKPPKQNSIDFLVEELPTVVIDPITKKQYKEYKLFTGYNALQWEPITVYEGVRLRYEKGYADSKKSVIDEYRLKLFKPDGFEARVSIAQLPIEVSGHSISEDNSIIENRTIVEFTYIPNLNKNISRNWVPLRVRTDKTRIYQKTGKLSKTVNDLSVSLSIWRSIHNPVSVDMITGIVPVLSSVLADTLEERILGADDIYYARTIPREHRLSINMLNFHNHGIKKRLYSLGKKEALLELACGMAGDLSRWRDSGYRFILGIDLVKDNITNPREGAYSIMLKQSKAVKLISEGIEEIIYPDTIFAVGDCSLPLHNGKTADGIDDESKNILRSLYKNISVGRYNRNWSQNKNELLPPQLVGKASKGFTTVSCMFSTHYFFKSEDTLNGFLKNVSDNLRKGGIFITTFMDGNKVHELLSESKNGIVDGRKLEANIPVWAIIRRYDNFQEGSYYGKKVDVFIENTNRLIAEYLVNFDLFVEKAQAFDLSLQETGMFSDDFARLRAQIPDDITKRSRLDNDIISLENDPIQSQFSFLNRWVVFRKL